MPKNKSAIRRAELLEMVKSYPELYDARFKAPANNRARAIAWSLIASTLDSTVEEVQRTWQQILQRNNKRRSLRSSIASDLDFLSNVELFNENSCVSSTCSSPTEAEKRSTRSTRSISVVSTASEAETSRSSKSIGGTVTQDRNKSRRTKSESLQQRSKRDSSESRTIECDSSTCETRQTSMEQSIQSCLSDQSPLMSKQRTICTPILNEKMKEYNVFDPTLTFFQSMAMTVSTFPQHIQANLKIEICKIVAEMESKLSMPTPC